MSHFNRCNLKVYFRKVSDESLCQDERLRHTSHEVFFHKYLKILRGIYFFHPVLSLSCFSNRTLNQFCQSFSIIYVKNSITWPENTEKIAPQSTI